MASGHGQPNVRPAQPIAGAALQSAANCARNPVLNDLTGNAALAEKYDAIAYGAQANALSHPSHLASIATLFGLRPADVDTCRVLEVGCSDGSNLLPMAA